MTLQPYDPPTNPALLDRTTDSWTAVLLDVVTLAENIANTEFVPGGLRGSVPKTVAAILHGRELGLPPMTSLAHTQVINGRPGTSAEVMRALILQAGHDLHIEVSTAERCTIKGRRSGWAEDRWTTVTFTMQDAARAGLLEDKRSKDGRVTPSMYKKWPQALLLARASTILARMIFADVIHGMRSVEELQDMDGADAAGYVPDQPNTTTVSRQSSLGSSPAVEAEAPQQGGAAASEGVGAATSEQQPVVPAPARGRRRAGLTPRGAKAAPPAAAEEEPETVAAEVVVAEVVEAVGAELATETTEPTLPADDWRRRTTTQVQMQWERLLGKPVQRDERLFWTGVLVGRPVESTNELTDEELANLLNRLGALRNLAALEALNKGADQDA
ncbi:MAG: hypothetical protein CVT62_10565 [Actinobacteria bacterium HGW-Actinobacteria-2]|nr:MAG: hypothetical protein CVT62_10565 [Actinobacteria bacterium HGW-Actinobacteria-2]